MIVDGDFGADMAIYTVSTSGNTTRDEMRSVLNMQYTIFTWQVDRKCHMISASSSFDKMAKRKYHIIS
jgi:hypothetical protein